MRQITIDNIRTNVLLSACLRLFELVYGESVDMERIERYLDRVEVVISQSTIDDPGADPSGAESDLLPEFCRYKDEGCRLSPSCLECPFPHCVDDKPRGRRQFVRCVREGQIREAYTAEKPNIKDLAARFHVSRRTVERAIEDLRPL